MRLVPTCRQIYRAAVITIRGEVRPSVRFHTAIPSVFERSGYRFASRKRVRQKIRASASFENALYLGDQSGRFIDVGAGPPIHRHEAGGLLDPPQPAADRREGRKVVVAL